MGLHTCSTAPSAAADTDKIWGAAVDTVLPTPFTPPTITCCSPVPWTAPADGTTHPATTSYMGFWYLNAGLGPKSPCGSSTGTPPTFDNDATINQSAYATGSPFDLTGAPYNCTSTDGQTKLAWNGTTLTIKGTVFIDGSAQSSSNSALYIGKGTIILSGLFTMSNGNQLCANADCGVGTPTPTPWDADTTALAIVTDGLDTKVSTLNDGIIINKGKFQGLLFANGNVDARVSGTVDVGPMVSVYHDVFAGQSGTLQFPPISFAGSGTDGLNGPLPLPQLLSPIEYGGG